MNRLEPHGGQKAEHCLSRRLVTAMHHHDPARLSRRTRNRVRSLACWLIHLGVAHELKPFFEGREHVNARLDSFFASAGSRFRFA